MISVPKVGHHTLFKPSKPYALQTQLSRWLALDSVDGRAEAFSASGGARSVPTVPARPLQYLRPPTDPPDPPDRGARSVTPDRSRVATYRRPEAAQLARSLRRRAVGGAEDWYTIPTRSIRQRARALRPSRGPRCRCPSTRCRWRSLCRTAARPTSVSTRRASDRGGTGARRPPSKARSDPITTFVRYRRQTARRNPG